MRTIGPFAVVVLYGAVSVAPARAQQPAAPHFVDPAKGMTLQQLLDTARSNEPGLRTSVLAAEALKADVRQAALRANPRLSFEQREQLGGMDRQTTASAEWPLELFRRPARVAVARADVEVAQANTKNQERLLVREVRAAHARYLAAARTVTVFDELAQQARTTVGLLEARAAAGAIPRLERDQASVELSRVEARRLGAIGAAEMAGIDLQRAAGLTPSRGFTVRDPLEAAIPWSELDALLAASADAGSVASRPDVRAADAQVDAENARRNHAAAGGRVDVSLFAGYMRMASGFPQQGVGMSGALQPIEGIFHNVAAGVMIDVPLFNRNQGAIAAAEFRASAATQEAAGRRLAAVSDVQGAAARLRAARAAAQVFTGPLRDTARRNVDVVREAHSLGRNTLLEVIVEQQRYLEVEMAYTDALMEVLDAHAALMAASGR